jgi:type IV secretion system protein VirB9
MQLGKWKTAWIVAAAMQAMSTTVLAAQALYTVEDAVGIGAKIEYPYTDGSLYEVYTQVGHASEIILHTDEKVTDIIAGDTSRWLVETAQIGGTVHVFVKPKATGISTNFILTTNQRAYHLKLLADPGTYNPMVCWRYPEDVYQAESAKSSEEKAYEEIFTEKRKGETLVKVMNHGYELHGSDEAEKNLYPLQVFDDGVRTYIQIPKSNKYDLPVLYHVNDKEKQKLTLVNYRIRYGYFIADRVFDHARLQYSAKEYVDILPKKTAAEARDF